MKDICENILHRNNQLNLTSFEMEMRFTSYEKKMNAKIRKYIWYLQDPDSLIYTVRAPFDCKLSLYTNK